MLDLSAVNHSIAVAEHLSIRRAAEHLRVRPSAVSRRVRGVEEKLGITIFERHSTGIRTTAAGRRFLDRARWAMAELDLAQRDAANIERGDGGLLNVAFFPSLASERLHDLLAAHQARFRDLTLSFLEGAPADQLIALRQRHADVAFLVAVEDAPGADSEQLWRSTSI